MVRSVLMVSLSNHGAPSSFPCVPSETSAATALNLSQMPSSRLSSLSSVEQALSDDLLHDLRGTSRDAHDARVDIGARDRVFEHVAVAAEELQAFVDRLHMQVARIKLRHRGIDGIEFVLQIERDALIDEGPPRRDLRCEPGQHEARIL